MSSPPLAIFLFLLPCFLALTVSQQEQDGTIAVGSVITATKSGSGAAWISPSGRFAFGFYAVEAEFAVGVWFVTNTIVIWTANRDGGLLPEGTKLKLTDDGPQIPSPNGDRPICNITINELKLASAVMKDSGNFVILNVNNKIMWQTFDNPTDTLMAGQLLRAGNKLVSSVSATNQSSGRFQVVMQYDGNLVWYPVNTPDTAGHAYWSFGFAGDGYTSVLLDEYGTLLQISDSNVTHNSTLVSLSTFAKIEPDGFLRAYHTNSSFTQLIREDPIAEHKCIIKGACGPNSYCNFTATASNSTATASNSTGFVQGEAACLCLPGFIYTDQSQPYMGCQMNFSMGQCIATKENKINYSITKLANISWSNDPYNYTDAGTEKDCDDSCLRDCNCYAALFANQRCNKERHPLLYGMSSADNPTVAFLKVGSGEPQLPPPPPPPAEAVNRVPSNKTLLLSVAIASALIVAMSVAVFLFSTNSGPSYQKLCRNMETGLSGGMAPRSFTHRQLGEATDGFTNLLGKGGFSTVFKGEISLGNSEVMPIAVKRLEKLSAVNEKGFRTEMRAVGRAHHRNVVRLLGFCHEGPKWLLIYEYMSRGSLADLIFPPQATQEIQAPKRAETRPSWKERAGIALDVARGILYLHEGCEATIIHSDIKPENVLVGEDGTAKIGDLGLAKLLMPRQSKTYTSPRGTLLYKAPEWEREASEPVSPKVDVYSFGVLLLELITCRKYILSKAVDGCHILSALAYKCLMESTLEGLVPEGEEVDKEELKKMVMVALWCLQKAPGQRKSMREVVRMMEGKTSITVPPDSIF